MDKKAIEFHAVVYSVLTRQDGSIRVVIELPEYCADQAKVLMGWTRHLLRVWMAEDGE